MDVGYTGNTQQEIIELVVEVTMIGRMTMTAEVETWVVKLMTNATAAMIDWTDEADARMRRRKFIERKR